MAEVSEADRRTIDGPTAAFDISFRIVSLKILTLMFIIDDILHYLVQIQLLSENIKEEFDEYIGVEVKSKKGNGIAIFCLGRSKLYLFQVHKGKATVRSSYQHASSVIEYPCIPSILTQL